MVLLKSEQLRLKGMVTEALTTLCRNGLSFRSEFCIEGLLGITLDNDDIFLINIKETITNDRGLNPHMAIEQRDLCDLTTTAALNDASFLMGSGNINTTLDFSKTGLMCEKTDKQDAFQLNALDLNISSGSYGKLSDLEMLFDLSTTPGRKKDLIPMDMTTSLLGQENDVEQLLNKAHNAKEEDDDEGMSEDSDLVLIKEEGRLHQVENHHIATVTTRHDVVPINSLESSTITSHCTDSMFLNLKDDHLASCSAWDGADCLDATCVPLNLSDPQDPEPQDLSTNQTKQKSKHVCDVCGRKFRSESGLLKHKDKEHPDDLLVTDMPQALALIRDPSSQPLDLTTGRSENDGEGDLDHELTISEHEPFTCICSKVISDYESYIDHVTNCSKSRLTPCKSCEICGKYFFSNSGYVKHKRLHVGAYKFHCNVCHKGFFDRTHMSAHMDSSHSKVRRYECEFCSKSFFWKHHLKRHKTTCDKAKLFIRNLSIEESLTEDLSMDVNDKYPMEHQVILSEKSKLLNLNRLAGEEGPSQDLTADLLPHSSLITMTT